MKMELCNLGVVLCGICTMYTGTMWLFGFSHSTHCTVHYELNCNVHKYNITAADAQNMYE